jgi:hypothetical protein
MVIKPFFDVIYFLKVTVGLVSNGLTYFGQTSFITLVLGQFDVDEEV